MRLNPLMIVQTMMMVLFLGCAGQPIKGIKTEPNPLRGKVHERFNQSISSSGTIAWLNRTDYELNDPDQQLERELLRELAGVKNYEDTEKVVDRLWETSRLFREIVSGSGPWKGYEHSLAEIYYLLSSVQASTWEKEVAEKLYQQNRSDMQPDQLSGYSLHFYTQALLLNGKTGAAMPFLTRLSQFKSVDYYLDDLSYAMARSLAGGDTDNALKIMVHILKTGMADYPDKVDHILSSEMAEFQRVGMIDQIQRTITPMAVKHPEFEAHRFASLLRDYQSAPAGSSPKSDVVNVQVQVICASKNDDYVDPALAGIVESLNNSLNFSGFRLSKVRHFQLIKQEPARMSILGGYQLTIIPVELSGLSSKLEVAIRREDVRVFNTLVQTFNDGMTVIGGPVIGDGMILIRIKTDFKLPTRNI